MNIEYVKKTAKIALAAMKGRQSPMCQITHTFGFSSSWEYPNLVIVNDGTFIESYTYRALNSDVAFQRYETIKIKT